MDYPIKFRPMTPQELDGFQGVKVVEEAVAADLEIEGVEALLLCEPDTVQVHIFGPDDEGPICYALTYERPAEKAAGFARLMANATLAQANGDAGLTFRWMEENFELICGKDPTLFLSEDYHNTAE